MKRKDFVAISLLFRIKKSILKDFVGDKQETPQRCELTTNVLCWISRRQLCNSKAQWPPIRRIRSNMKTTL